MVRPTSDLRLIDGVDVELFEGDLGDYDCFPKALEGIDVVVHTGAHIGDWGPAEKYRAINVVGLEHFLTAAEREGCLKRWIQISSLGVYAARHHYGTDETVPPSLKGLDGYTQTKAEAEEVLKRHIQEFELPAVIMRPRTTPSREFLSSVIVRSPSSGSTKPRALHSTSTRRSECRAFWTWLLE